MNRFIKNYYEERHKKSYNELYERKTESINLSTRLRIKRIDSFIQSGKDILELSVISKMPWWNRNRITLADISNKPLKHHKEYPSKTFDFNNKFPFADETFDVVVATEVIEHLYNPEGAVKEIYRILRKDGMLIGSVPNEYHLRKRIEILFGKDVFGYGYHLCYFNKNSLKKLLKKIFKKVFITGYGPGVFLPSLMSSNLIFVCVKNHQSKTGGM